jgi:hypothetical protein
MTQWFRSEAWRLRWLPFLTAAAGLTAAFLLQDVPIVRRHALLLALLAGLGFFLPAVRHRLLILFAYGLGLYFIVKSVATWLDLPLGELGAVERVLWFILGWMCVVSALGMGRRPCARVGSRAADGRAGAILSRTSPMCITRRTTGCRQSRAWV